MVHPAAMRQACGTAATKDFDIIQNTGYYFNQLVKSSFPNMVVAGSKA
jgi:hypothetical protein